MNTKTREMLKFRSQGLGAGALAVLVVGLWSGVIVTYGSAKEQAELAATTALLPVCADAILANPQAVLALQKKRSVDYDDVVRDYLKTVGNRTSLDLKFRRDCGDAINTRMIKASTK